MYKAELIKRIGKEPLCNKRPERAPHIGTFCFPLCWRCTAVLLGVLVVIIMGTSKLLSYGNTALVVAGILIIPCLVDGLLQYFTSYESNNYRRALTGFAAGIGIQTIIKLTFTMLFVI